MDPKIIVELASTRTGRGFGIESAGWEGGRLLPGAGNDKVLYYVNDHLGSVRTVKDGAGTVRQRYDYYPYGTVSRSWSSSSSSDTPDKRYRFGGKEIAGTPLSATATGSDKYLDFGARLYNPRSATCLSQDPMAEKYFPIGPCVYCAANPVNVVDSFGFWIWSPQGDLFWEEGDTVFTLSDFLGISLSDVFGIIERNSLFVSSGFSDGYYIQSNNLWIEPSATGITINNTFEAILHYYDNTGLPVNIGNKSTEEAISLIIKLHPNILNEEKGHGAIDMTDYTFHIGRTSYSFKVEQQKNSRVITYSIFLNDSFPDPAYFIEKMNLPFKRFQADFKGPNLELGGRPYDYVPKTRVYYKPLAFPRWSK